jgi:adenine phosphoribosyltransferase
VTTGDPRAALRAAVREIADHPTPGIQFKDITPLLADPARLAEAVTALGADVTAEFGPVDLVAGIEARGFILAAPVALALGAGFVPVRKAGKLPFTTVSAQFELEYATATIELHTDAVSPGQRVLLVDDVLATGGTAAAAAGLLTGLGAEVVAVSVLIELGFLTGRARLPDLPVRSVITY